MNILPNTIQSVFDPSTDYMCEICNDKPATVEGITHWGTLHEPTEWLGACDDCWGKDQPNA